MLALACESPNRLDCSYAFLSGEEGPSRRHGLGYCSWGAGCMYIISLEWRIEWKRNWKMKWKVGMCRGLLGYC